MAQYQCVKQKIILMISYIYKISCFDRFTFKFCNLLKRLKLFKTYITCFQEPSSTLPKQNVWTDAIFILMQFSHPPRFFCMICCKYRTGYISSTIFIYIYIDLPCSKIFLWIRRNIHAKNVICGTMQCINFWNSVSISFSHPTTICLKRYHFCKTKLFGLFQYCGLHSCII